MATNKESGSVHDYFSLGEEGAEGVERSEHDGKKYKEYERQLDRQVIGYFGYLELVPGCIQIISAILIAISWCLALWCYWYDRKWNMEVRKHWKNVNRTEYGDSIKKVAHDRFGRLNREEGYVNGYYEHGDELELTFVAIVAIMFLLLICHLLLSIYKKPDMGDRELEQQGLFSTWGLVFLMSGWLEGISALNVHLDESKHLVWVNNGSESTNLTIGDHTKICVCDKGQGSSCFKEDITKLWSELHICQQFTGKIFSSVLCTIAGLLLIAGAVHITVKHYLEHKRELKEETLMDPGTRLYALLQLRRAGYTIRDEDLRNPFYNHRGERIKEREFYFKYHAPHEELPPVFNKTKPDYLRRKRKPNKRRVHPKPANSQGLPPRMRKH